MSLRPSSGSPRACSGEKKVGVPSTTWRLVAVGEPATARAMPKSVTTARPSRANSTFSGFTSRCTMPCRCANASPRATSAPTRATSSLGSVPAPAMRSASESGSRSMTRYGVPGAAPSNASSSRPTVSTVMTFGWRNLAAIVASRRKRSTVSGSAASSGRRILSATSSSRSGSSAE